MIVTYSNTRRVRKHAVVDRVMKQVAPVRKWEKKLITVGKMKLIRWCPGDGSVVADRTPAAKTLATAALTANTRKATRSSRLAEAGMADSNATSPAGSAQPTPEVSPNASPLVQEGMSVDEGKAANIESSGAADWTKTETRLQLSKSQRTVLRTTHMSATVCLLVITLCFFFNFFFGQCFFFLYLTYYF